MDESEIKRLAEAVEAGLRDGRTLESLRRAMTESGYDPEDIKTVIANVDRKKIVRRPKRKRTDNRGRIAAVIVAVAAILILGIYVYTIYTGQPSGVVEKPPAGTEPKEVLRVCYAINETVMEIMKESGANCDKWFLIREV